VGQFYIAVNNTNQPLLVMPVSQARPEDDQVDTETPKSQTSTTQQALHNLTWYACFASSTCSRRTAGFKAFLQPYP
jgi:hypothetical protein